MALRNAFENLGLDSTLRAIRDRLPSALGGSGGVKVEQQGPVSAKVQDGSGNAITSTSGALDINVKSSGSLSSTEYSEGDSATTAKGGVALGKNGTIIKAVQTDSVGNLRVDLSQTGGNSTAIKVDGSTVTQPVTQTPAASGGVSVYRNINLGTTGASIKGSTGQIYGWYFYNNASSVRYVKLYNKATAPTVGTDTPVMTVPLPANAAANVSFPNGIAFSSGIGIGASTGVADADVGAPAANDVIANINYF